MDFIILNLNKPTLMSKELNNRDWNEIDLSDVWKEIETHSKKSCRYFFENSSPSLEEVPFK
jgi:hypothetical protein